jgi:uncharacterized protein with GYD domain
VVEPAAVGSPTVRGEEHIVPTYIVLTKWTDQGIRGVKDMASRLEQNRAAADKLGLRAIGTWWTQGAYDGVNVVEAPDEETLMVGLLTLGMGGNIRTETMRAFSAEEMQQIIQKLP